jgi:DNA-binding NarL/FixJ family response regulator
MDGSHAAGVAVPRTTVLIAARPTLFRLGLVGILKDHQTQWNLLEVDTFRTALALPLKQGSNVLLLDECLPDLNGMEGLRRATELLPQVKIIMLAGSDDRDRLLDFIDAGAHGCLTTSASPSQVIAAFNTVLCGGIFIPAPAREAIAMPRPVAVGTSPVGNLTERQRSVFDLMARGYSTKLIARELGLAVGTVKVHLAAIYRLLGAHNRSEAIARLVNGSVAVDERALSAMLSDLGWTP